MEGEPGAKKESGETMHTTPTERRRAKVISRFFVNIFKCFRMCKKQKVNDV